MRRTKWFMSSATSVIFVVSIGCIGTAPALADEEDHGTGKEKTLYICAGDQAHKIPDFLAVIDFDEESADYGKVIIALCGESFRGTLYVPGMAEGAPGWTASTHMASPRGRT